MIIVIARAVLAGFYAWVALILGAPDWAAFLGGMVVAFQTLPVRMGGVVIRLGEIRRVAQ